MIGAFFAGKSAISLLRVAAPFLAIAALVLLFWWLWSKNQSLNQEIGQIKSELKLSREVNQSNVSEIEKAMAANQSCINQWQSAVAVSDRQLSNLEVRYEALSEEKARVRIIRKEVFSTPACEDLGNMDINAICPDLADGLRNNARSVDQD